MIWRRIADYLVPADALRLLPTLEDRTLAAAYAYRLLAANIGAHLAVPLQEAVAIIERVLTGHQEQIRVWGEFRP